MNVKYLEINAHPEVEPEDSNFVLNKAINRLHGLFRSQEIHAGIDLPHSTDTSLGDTIRIFGREPVLNAVLNNTGIQELQRRRMIKLQSVKDIPEGAKKIRVKRIRNRDNNELLKKARRKREYLLSKGVDPETVGSIQTLKAQKRNREQLPYFLIEKNGRKHSVFFTWTTINEEASWSEAGFNSYGLSSNLAGYAYRF